MSKKIIAVDIDDTLADLATQVVKYVNKTWGHNIKNEEYDEYWSDMYPEFDFEEKLLIAYAIFEAPEVYPKLKKLLNAHEVLLELKKKYKIVALTSRVKEIHAVTKTWLEENLPGAIEEIHYSGAYDDDKSEATQHLTKGEIAKKLGVDYLIDDQPKHINLAAEQGIKALMFGDYHWNRDVKLHPDVVRVKDWLEVQKFFDTHN